MSAANDAEAIPCNFDFAFDPEGDVILIVTKKTAETSQATSIHERSNNPDAENTMDFDEDVIIVEDRSSRKFRFRVSSRHLILASSVFRAMLSRNFREGTTLKAVGIVEIDLPDDDPDALALLLNVIHSRSKSVPPKLGLSSLCRLALLVDKYQMHEAFNLLASMWIAHAVSKGWPEKFDARMRQMLYVSWVFRSPREFRGSTRFAIKESTGQITDDMQDFPISDAVLVKIEERRMRAISTLLEAMYDFLREYQRPNPHCRSHCDAMILGSVTRNLESIGILTKPPAPYTGYSYKLLYETLRKMRIESYCGFIDGSYIQQPCNRDAHRRIRRLTDKVEIEVHGIALDEIGAP